MRLRHLLPISLFFLLLGLVPGRAGAVAAVWSVGTARCMGASAPPPVARPRPNRYRQDTTLLRIHRLQDARAAPALLAFLTHPNPAYRAEAADAFASVQAPAARGSLEKLLAADPAPLVRRAAARALGLLADTLAQPAILAAARAEADPMVRATVLEGLGRVATSIGGGLRYLAEEALPLDTVARAGWAWGLTRAGLRGVVNDEAVARAVQLLGAEQPLAVRLAAAHLLARTPRLDLTSHGPAVLTALRIDPNRDVRIALTGTLGRIASPPATAATLNLLRAAPDAHVRLAALRAAGKLRYEQVKESAWGALADADPLVALSAAEYFLQNAPADEAAAMFRHRGAHHPDPQTQATLFATALKLSAAHADAGPGIIQEITTRLQAASTDTRRAFWLRALGQSPAGYELLVRETLTPPLRPIIATAGLEALIALRGRPDFPVGQRAAFAATLRQAVETGDVALVGLAAGALRDPALNLRADFPELGFLTAARQRLVLPRDVETAQELDQALAYLEGKPAPPPITPSAADLRAQLAAHPTDWKRVLKLPAGQLVTVSTNRGAFTLELLVEAAPAAAASFAGLVERKFYDGQLFHRVVPNFVAQGGDPRGDGWGGLDYTLRSELADESFSTGAVGLASAGLNTESCQWFVMHCPAPHLDGRYTLFARVRAGQVVVDALRVGDVIEKVRLQ
ncbi:MAG: peptidylprolyl isomerase [Hymenobacteraceae bacterium]|nr:peptidylprolyl isomerase [Hymenobacteraceae bacterium]